MSTADPSPSEITGWERERLRRAFDMLPKVAERDDNALERRNDIPPEWVMAIIADSFAVSFSFQRHSRESGNPETLSIKT